MAAKKQYEKDLIDASDAMESILAQLEKLPLTEKVDIGARVKAVLKSADKIDEAIKDSIKTKLANKEGTVLGDIFKAELKIIEKSFLNQKRLKEEKPKIAADYTELRDERHVTYDVR